LLGDAYSDRLRAPMMPSEGGCEAGAMEIRKPPPLERDPADEPQIDTPIIDIQDVGHRARELPQLDLSKDDEKARQAIEEFERSLKEQPPG
jgi:hypothetical protein